MQGNQSRRAPSAVRDADMPIDANEGVSASRRTDDA